MQRRCVGHSVMASAPLEEASRARASDTDEDDRLCQARVAGQLHPTVATLLTLTLNLQHCDRRDKGGKRSG